MSHVAPGPGMLPVFLQALQMLQLQKDLAVFVMLTRVDSC